MATDVQPDSLFAVLAISSTWWRAPASSIANWPALPAVWKGPPTVWHIKYGD